MPGDGGTPLGAGYVTIYPTLDPSGLSDDLTRAAEEAGSEAGDAAGEAFKASLDASTEDAHARIDDSAEEGAKAGVEAGEGFRSGFDAATDDLGASLDGRTLGQQFSDSFGQDFEGRLDELSSRANDITVGVDDDDALAKIAVLSASIDRLGKQIHLGVDDEDFASVEAKLLALGAELDAIENPPKPPGGGFLDTFGGDSGDAGAEASGLLSAALALTPALVAVGVAGATALGGVAAAAGTAALGVGAFALAAEPELAGIKTQAEGMLAVFQQNETQAVLPALQGGLRLLPILLNAVTPAVSAVSTSLQGLEASAERALDGAFYQRFFLILDGQGAQSLTAFGHFLGGAATAVAGLDEAFAPFIADVDRDLTRLGADMSSFGQQAGSSSGIAAFIDYIHTNGPLIVHTLEDVGSAVVGLAKDASPLAPIELQVVGAGAKLIDSLENLSPGLVEAGVAILSIYKASQLLPFSLTSAGNAIVGLFKASQAAGSLGGGIAGLGAEAGGAAGAVTSLGAAAFLAVPGLDLVAAAIGQQAGLFDNFDQSADKAGKAFATDFVDSLGTGADKVAAVNQELASLTSQENALTAQMSALQAKIASPGQPVDAISAQYKALGTQLEALDGKSKELSATLPGLTTAQNAQNAAIAAAGAASNASLTPTETFAQSLSKMATEAGSVTSELDAANAALNVLTGSAAASDQANIAFEQNLDSLGKTLVTNKLSLDESTQAGQANKTAIDQTVSSITTYVGALEKQGASTATVSAAMTGQVASFDAVLAKAGLTQAQIQTLNATYGLTPKDITTDVAIYGASGVATTVAGINGYLATIPATKAVTIEVNAVIATGALPAGIAHGAEQLGYAEGTDAATAGYHWVGENGPELLSFGGGETVIPHDESMAMASAPGYADGIGDVPAGPAGHGPALVIEQATFTDAADVDMLLNRASFALTAGRFGATR